MDLCFVPAKKLARLIRGRKLSATEVMKAYIAQIERVNPKVNAMVTFLPELALAAARKFDKHFKSNPANFKPLAGLPIAYKDLIPTRGIRTTSGSPIYRDHVPLQDHSIVERLSAAGAVACGMLPFADGSDLAASLRNPVNQLPPFPVDQPYPTEIAGEKMTNYLDWMKSCYYITITSHPAISVPAGFTDDARPLPVGLQIVGRYRDDFGVLQLAHAFEQQTQAWQQRPPIAIA